MKVTVMVNDLSVFFINLNAPWYLFQSAVLEKTDTRSPAIVHEQLIGYENLANQIGAFSLVSFSSQVLLVLKCCRPFN